MVISWKLESTSPPPPGTPVAAVITFHSCPAPSRRGAPAVAPLDRGQVDVSSAMSLLRDQGWDVAAELSRPLATAPHVPRSLVNPLAAVLRDLARQTVEATRRGAQDLAKDCWLAFLAY